MPTERERGKIRRAKPHNLEYQRRYQLERYHRTKRPGDGEKTRAYRAAYYAKNRERLLESQRKRSKVTYQQNKPAHAARNRRGRLATFGMTENDYQDMLDWQGRVCAICGRAPGSMKMCVDHDHETGEIRGILCSQCNRALGLFRESAELLTIAADYLTKSLSGATLTMSSDESNLPYYLRGFHVRPSSVRKESRIAKPS